MSPFKRARHVFSNSIPQSMSQWYHLESSRALSFWPPTEDADRRPLIEMNVWPLRALFFCLERFLRHFFPAPEHVTTPIWARLTHTENAIKTIKKIGRDSPVWSNPMTNAWISRNFHTSIFVPIRKCNEMCLKKMVIFSCAIVSRGIYVERKTQFSIKLKNLPVSLDAVALSPPTVNRKRSRCSWSLANAAIA